MKKIYLKPTTEVVEIEQMSYLLNGSGIKSINSNAVDFGDSDEGIEDIVLRGREAEFDDGEWFEE